MKNKSTTKQHHKPKTTPVAKKKSPLWIVVVVIVVASIGGVTWRLYTADKSAQNSTPSATTVNAPSKADHDLLIGRWTRTDSDGAYVIEIKSAGADGKLEASYFNPNPIKVGHAEWQKKSNALMVVVELRDVNYPGSTYTLNFIPSENRMTGNYYQAVQGQNFDVEFVRAR
jgi:hypothetical protein